MIKTQNSKNYANRRIIYANNSCFIAKQSIYGFHMFINIKEFWRIVCKRWCCR